MSAGQAAESRPRLRHCEGLCLLASEGLWSSLCTLGPGVGMEPESGVRAAPSPSSQCPGLGSREDGKQAETRELRRGLTRTKPSPPRRKGQAGQWPRRTLSQSWASPALQDATGCQSRLWPGPGHPCAGGWPSGVPRGRVQLVCPTSTHTQPPAHEARTWSHGDKALPRKCEVAVLSLSVAAAKR